MVWIRGYVFKFEDMDHAFGVPASHHSSVKEQDTILYLSYVLDYNPGDHCTSASAMSVGSGY